MTYSIIIPTYNSAKVIKHCLDSIIEQTYKDYEILVMDGCSKDETVQIVLSYKDNRIKVYSKPDKGIYDAMNKGIDIAMGDWLLFLGSDDYLFNSEVLSNVSHYLSKDFDVVYGESESHWSEMHRGEWSLEKLEANRVHQAIFYNRRFFGHTLRYNIQYKVCADFDMNLKWFLNKKYHHKYIPVTISHMSDGGMSSVVKDEAFYKNYGLNKIMYNQHVLTPLYKKRAARQYIQENPNKIIMKFILTIYVYNMIIFQKISDACKL